MNINDTLTGFLKNQGVDIIRFIDISSLPGNITRNYPNAILIGKTLSKNYLSNSLDNDEVDCIEFSEDEDFTDRTAETLADFLNSKGYKSYAQSETNIIRDGFIDSDTFTSILPHKTIALLAGMGWIGKNDLLVSHEYGSGLSMCTVLTDAPVITENKNLIESQCGECVICKNVCPQDAIKGKNWELGCSRISLIDIAVCIGCLKCLVNCTWTQRYAHSN